MDIPPGDSQSFVVAFTPTAAFAPTDVGFNFDCSNTDPAPSLAGVNTLLLSASNTPVADVIAVAVTASGDGIVNLPSETGSAAFALASASVGADAGLVSISASPLNAGLPVSMALCETNPRDGSVPFSTDAHDIESDLRQRHSVLCGLCYRLRCFSI